jgi:hypothetical protein
MLNGLDSATAKKLESSIDRSAYRERFRRRARRGKDGEWLARFHFSSFERAADGSYSMVTVQLSISVRDGPVKPMPIGLDRRVILRSGVSRKLIIGLPVHFLKG